MSLEVDEDNLKEGLLGLVIALVEIIIEALEIQAIKRMESGNITEMEINRLGEALIDLDKAITNIKIEHGIEEAAESVREGLDEIVDEVIDKMINPERWQEEKNNDNLLV